MRISKYLYLAILLLVAVSCSKDEEEVGPKNLTVEKKEKGFRLDWDDGEMEDAVYRVVGGGEPKFLVNPENRVFYEDYSHLELGQSYSYQIVRHNGDTPTDMKTDIVTVMAEGFSPRVDEVEVSRDPDEPRSAMISWEVFYKDELSADAKIRVKKSSDKGYTWNTIETIEDITQEGTYIDPYALNPDSRNDYQVALYDGDDMEPIAAEDDFIRVEHNYDLIPTNLSVAIENRDNNEFATSWDPAADAESYVITFKVNDEGWSDNYNVGTNTEGVFTIDGELNEDDVIKFKVGGQKGEHTEYCEPVEVTW